MYKYIRANEADEMDYGYGFTSNGDAIDESMVDELYRIASETLDQTELAQLDPYVSISEDSFEYYASSPYVGVEYEIAFDAFSDKFDINSFIDPEKAESAKKWGVITDSGKYEITVRFSIYVKGEQIEPSIEDILVKDSGYFNDYLSREYADILDEDRFCDYIIDLAAPAVNEIFNAISNI